MKFNFKFGLVSEAKAGFAKVYFAEDNHVTDWLPMLVKTSMKDKESWILNINEHVCVVCNEFLEEGVILGAIHSDPEPADDGAAPSKFRKVFEDGSILEYDKSEHKLTAAIKGDVLISADGNIDATSKDAVISASGNVEITAQTCKITSPEITLAGTVTVEGELSAGGMTVKSTLGGSGKMTGDGDINTTGDIKSNGISLAQHKHGGVSFGSSETTTPIP